MGRQTVDQSQLFYLFNLEEHIPTGHLLRRINPIVRRVLADLREKLAPFYSDIGRPSIDPELMIRMPLSDGWRCSSPPGRRTVKTESLATVTSPPIMRASLREIGKPSPVPP
jgi:hypothetical protein